MVSVFVTGFISYCREYLQWCNSGGSNVIKVVSVFDWLNKECHLCSISGTRVFFKWYFYWKADIQRGGEIERNIYSLIQSPSDCKGLSCADPKPGTRNAVLILPCGCKVPVLCSVLKCFPSPQAGSWMGSWVPTISTGTYMRSWPLQALDFNC